MFTRRSVHDANMASKIKKLLLSPSERDMVHIIERSLLKNMYIIRKKIAAANKIFGPALNVIKGKKTSHKNPEVKVEIASVPVGIISLYRQVTVASDILFVNITPFLVSVILHLKFVTVECIKTIALPPWSRLYAQSRRPICYGVSTLLSSRWILGLNHFALILLIITSS